MTERPPLPVLTRAALDRAFTHPAVRRAVERFVLAALLNLKPSEDS